MERDCLGDKENLVRNGVRSSTKSKLTRLGQLYSGKEISSPIQRTEEAFAVEAEEQWPRESRSGPPAGRSARLAALACKINEWEDQGRRSPLRTSVNQTSRTRGPSPVKMGVSGIKSSAVLELAKQYQTDKGCLPQKDPAQLPLALRKAIFDKGEALLPKAPFAMPVPAKVLQNTESKPPPRPTSLNRKVAMFERMNEKTCERNSAMLERMEREKELEALRRRWEVEREKGSRESSEEEDEHSMNEESSFSEDDMVKSDRVEYDEIEETLPPPPPPSPPPPPCTSSPANLSHMALLKVSPPKPGYMYPDLTALEWEDRDSLLEDPNETSSTASSLGARIVRTSRSHLKRAPPPPLSEESKVLNDMNEYLDEVLLDETVRKKSRSQSPEVDKPPEVAELRLTHSVSVYRRQVSTVEPVRKEVHKGEEWEEMSEEEAKKKEKELIRERIEWLTGEVRKQEVVIAQSSQALNLCKASLEFSGSAEMLEGERLLLVATERRRACLEETERLKVGGCLWARPGGSLAHYLGDRGTLSVQDLAVPLRMDMVRLAATEEQAYHLFCLVRAGPVVLATELLSAIPPTLKSDHRLVFSTKKPLKLDNLYCDFIVTIEVYCLKERANEIIPHDVKYHISRAPKKEKVKTPKKGARIVMASPGGPGAVRTSAFKPAGYVTFSLRDVGRTHFTLNRVGYGSVLEGSLGVRLATSLAGSSQTTPLYKGFLSVCQKRDGCETWKRRWTAVYPERLAFWAYREDESSVPIETIELETCVSREVRPAPPEICPRSHTFFMELKRAEGVEVQLMSADSKEERVAWCRALTRSLGLLQAWGRSN